jgi:hypothetical protein
MVRQPDATMQPSRNFNLNGEASTAGTKQNNPIISLA